MKFLTTVALGLFIVAFASTGVSFAQKNDPNRKPRVIRIDTVKVEGRIQKPEAFYILQRSELNFEGLEPKKSFVPLIIKSVDKEPF